MRNDDLSQKDQKGLGSCFTRLRGEAATASGRLLQAGGRWSAPKCVATSAPVSSQGYARVQLLDIISRAVETNRCD